MKVFVGISEIANMVSAYSRGFEKAGCQTYSVIGNRNPFLPAAKYDLVLSEVVGDIAGAQQLSTMLWLRIKSRLIAWKTFLHALFSCDLFVYVTGGSLLPAYLDYALIRLLRKKLVVAFLGSEIRHWYAYAEEMAQIGKQEAIEPVVAVFRDHAYADYDAIVARISAAERYADIILSQPGFAQLQTRPYMRVTVGLDLTQFPFHLSEGTTPLVLHAPSSRGVKGTDYVLQAVDTLRSEGLDFEFRLIEGMAHPELVKLLGSAAIVVDELFSDTIGVLSTESMATGNAVLTSYFGDYAKVAPGCPVVHVDKDTITDRLREVVVDRNLRLALAYRGREYVETHHNATKVAVQILHWLQPDGIAQYDFIPHFVHTFHIPGEVVKAERQQRWHKRIGRIRSLLQLPT